MSEILKVSNGAKIRNRYNQVPHLTQDTKVFLEVHGRDIDFAKSEQSYHLTSTDADAAAVRLPLPLHRKRYIPESYSIVCIYVKWH